MVTEQFANLSLERIKVQRNVRKTFDEKSLDRLLWSMREHGLLEPIRVQQVGEWYIVIKGESRLRCAQSLEWKTIPAIIVSGQLAEAEVLEQQLVENIARTDLPPLEKAQGIRDFMEVSQCNASQAAAQLGLSNADVSRSLALLSVPEAIQKLIESGAISPSMGYELAMINDPAKQMEQAQLAASGKLTRDALSGKRKAKKQSKCEPDAKPISRVTAVLGINKAVTVAGQSLTLDDFITLLEECLAKARQSRTKGLALSTFVRMCKDTAQAT